MRKRSRYTPKPVALAPLANLRPLPADEIQRRRMQLLTAIEAIAAGSHPGRSEWDEVVNAGNRLDTVLSNGRLQVEDKAHTMALILQAESGLIAAGVRYSKGQGMRLDGPSLAALRDIAQAWLWCIEHWTAGDLWRVDQETSARIDRMRRDKTVRVVTLEAA
jgi:hypothetical protein